MASLNDTITRVRIAEVHDAHEKTFHWLFDREAVSFPDWLSDNSSAERPIYWIQGKPGSGKSTLMKFAMRDPRMTELLASDDMEQWSLAAFFFHDRGSEKQKTLNGMLQELLRSILQQIPALSRYVLSSYLELVRSQRTRCPSWDFSSLKSALVSLLEQRHVKIRILLLLDALDEHQGDNDMLASLLKTLVDKSDNERVKLKMCLASRSWTVFQQHFGNRPGFSIHDHTREDIMTYIKAKLEHCGPQEIHQSNHDNITPLASLVATRASGVFIWVRLVVDLLAKGIQDGTPNRILEEKVNKIPQELRDLYADTLRRIEAEYSTEAFIMLQTTLCSFEPLPLKALMFVSDINTSLCERNTVPGDGIWYNGDLTEQSTGSRKSRIASRSGGLLEVVQRDQSESESESESDGLVVQFIHQTVKEYVQSASKNLGLAQISSKIHQDNGYNFLLRTCVYCYHEWVSCIKKDIFDYARCAAKKCKEDYGAHESECSRLISEIVKTVDYSMNPSPSGSNDLQLFLAQQEGIFFTDLLNEVRDGKTWEMLLPRLAVAMNFPEYFVHHPEVPRGGWDHAALLLHMAVAVPGINTRIRDADHEYMIRVLVGVGCDVNEENLGMLKYGDLYPSLNKFIHREVMTPLSQTLIFKAGPEDVRLSIVKTLFDLGASADFRIWFYPTTFGTVHSCSLLEYCVLHESAAFVRLLLQHGAKPTTDSIRDASELLRFARIRQDAAVVQTLLDFGVGNVKGENTSDDLASVKEAVRVQSHILAAPSGGLSTALFSREYDLERVRITRPNVLLTHWGPSKLDRDFNAATDSQVDLAITRPITHSLPISTTFIDTH